MKQTLLLIFIAFSIANLFSQETLNPCGTVEGRSEWLKNYQRNPTSFPRSDTKLYIPLKLHLVGTNQGKGRISPENLLGTLCTINEDYAAADIQFYFDGGLNYIDNSSYLIHSTILEGADMMFENNVDNAVNIYIVSSPAGNCGYNLPYAGIALGINCAKPTDHTLSHELGHNFSLPHPFLGWEGGVSYDNSVNHDYNNPAPDRVTIDYTNFKDTLIRDTLIIDTIWVENVNGSNCTYAADGFCDTKPDYISTRWTCNATGASSVIQTDPLGEKFRSDGTLIMSYSNDECANRFTDDQINAMRAQIMDQRSNLLYDQSEPVLISNPDVTLISPINGEVVDYRYINLEWEEVPQATHYAVKISTNENFTSKLFDGIVTTNTVLASIDKAWQNRDLFWSIIPFNKYDFCNTFTTVGIFKAATVSGSEEAQKTIVSFYPTIVNEKNTLYTNNSNSIESVSIYNMRGESIAVFYNIDNKIDLPNTINNGVYLLRITLKSNKVINQKIVIQD